MESTNRKKISIFQESNYFKRNKRNPSTSNSAQFSNENERQKTSFATATFRMSIITFAFFTTLKKTHNIFFMVMLKK